MTAPPAPIPVEGVATPQAADEARFAFDALLEAVHAVARQGVAHGPALRREVGRLMAEMQARDVFDQRMAHLTVAMAAIPVLGPVERAATLLVCSHQAWAVAEVLRAAGQGAATSFSRVARLAAEAGDAPQLAHATSAGRAAAARLGEAAAGIEAEGRALASGIDRDVSAEARRAADLSWLDALYTMEDERRTHALALAAPDG